MHKPRYASRLNLTVSMSVGVCLLLVFLFTRWGLNYTGVCTRIPEIWNWKRADDSTVLDVLNRIGPSNNGTKAEFKIVDHNLIAGDEYRQATFVDKVSGRARSLIKFYKPWMDNNTYLNPTGYFYVPNCIEDICSRDIP